jgi:hypothetical protein
MPPFEAVYGQKTPSILSYMPGISKVQEVDKNITVCEGIVHTLEANLDMAQNHMKQQAAKGRSERQFVEGDQVFLCQQRYKNTSLKGVHCKKHAPKF